MAVFAYEASCTTSLFGNFTPSRPHLLERNTRPQHFELAALLFANSSLNVFDVPQFFANKDCETEPPAYNPYLQRFEGLTFADEIRETALSPQLFRDTKHCFGQDLNTRPSDNLSETQPTEPTSQRSDKKKLTSCIKSVVGKTCCNDFIFSDEIAR